MKVRYRIMTWQAYDNKWVFVIKKYVRVTFKRSQRVGWRSLGFLRTNLDGKRFNSRAEALAFAKTLKPKTTI